MESNGPKVIRRYAKYVFLDVVQFSRRSAEAQSEVVEHLNEIVNQSLSGHDVKKGEHCILIPTGDGMCVALVSPDLPYDIHLNVALSTLALLDEHNKKMADENRRFQVRIGINQNTDILITDINDRPNIAGAGINMAARIMDKADGGQILVSQSVFEELQPSEAYTGKFRPFVATGKHDIQFQVHQYVNAGLTGLNVTLPSAFITPSAEEKKLTEVVARYIALTIVHRPTLLTVTRGHSYLTFPAVVLLWYLALDSYQDTVAGRSTALARSTRRVGSGSFADQLRHYSSQDYCVITDLHDCVVHEHLNDYDDCFEQGDYTKRHDFVNPKGIGKLKSEWPHIWDEFKLGQYL